jgi:hypothetical protein
VFKCTVWYSVGIKYLITFVAFMQVMFDLLKDITSSHNEIIVRIYPENNEAKKMPKHPFFHTLLKTYVDFGVFVPTQIINN